jgi:hypothetical protein
MLPGMGSKKPFLTSENSCRVPMRESRPDSARPNMSKSKMKIRKRIKRRIKIKIKKRTRGLAAPSSLRKEYP